MRVTPYAVLTAVFAAMRLDGALEWPWMAVIWPILLYIGLHVASFVVLWVNGMVREAREAEKCDEMP